MADYIKKSIKLGFDIEKKLKSDPPQDFETIKDYLKEKMGAPVGLHTRGIPLIFSTLFALLSFSIPQLSIWDMVFRWMSWPQYTVFTGIIAAGLVYCLLIFPSMTLVARGNLAALKFYLLLILFTAILATLYLLYTVIALTLGIENHTGFLIGAIMACIFILISYRFLNSRAWVKTMAFYLHNRVWRLQLKHHNQTLVKRK